jgi:hypothetical protein
MSLSEKIEAMERHAKLIQTQRQTVSAEQSKKGD